MNNNYEKLEVFKISYIVALHVHKMSLKLPKEIQFDLADQVRRASRSIPTNIAEGYGKRISQKDFKRFLWIAVGSKDEMIVHLNFLKDLGYVNSKVFYQLQR